MTETPSRGNAAAAALVFAACGADPGATGGWVGTVYDSAGVLVIDNPASGLWTSGTAWRLEEDLRIGVPDGSSVL